MTVLARLSPREKVLVLLLFLVAVPLALWALVAQPMQEARARAVGALASAQANYVWVAEQAQRFAATAQIGTNAPRPPAGLAGVEAALIAEGLREAVTTLEATPDGGVRLELAAVPFDSFGRFLDAAAYSLGYQIVDLTISPAAESGKVDARLGLSPHAP